MGLLHNLEKDDFDLRMQFYEEIMTVCHDDSTFAQQICFSIEANFCMHY